MAVDTPQAYVYVKLTEREDEFMVDHFLQNECPNEVRSNALPFNDESTGMFTGLITKFDADRLRNISPQGGRYNLELNNKLLEIARSKNCNIILWISENIYCYERIDFFVNEMRKILQGTIREPPKLVPNNLKTIVIMAACRSHKWAHELNSLDGFSPIQPGSVTRNNPTGNPRRREDGTPRTHIEKVIERPVSESQKPIFLGFNGFVHPYKSDLFVCETLITSYPSIVCPNRNRQQCCQKHLQAFQRYFVEELKGDRNCTKINREGIESRIDNIIRKIENGSAENRARLIPEDSIIRSYNSNRSGGEIDGIFCKRDDCEIVNDIDPQLVVDSKRLASHAGLSRYIWGQLMRDLNPVYEKEGNIDTGTYGKNFDTLFDSIPGEEIRGVVNTPNIKGETALFKLFLHSRIADRGAKIVKVIKAGGKINGIRPEGSSVSIASLALNENNFNLERASILKYTLLHTDIDVLEDPILRSKRTEAGDRGLSDEDQRFKKSIEELVNELRSGLTGNKKQKMNDFLTKEVATYFDIPLNKVLVGSEPPYVKYSKRPGRLINDDMKILNVLRRPITFENRNMIFYDYLMEKKNTIMRTSTNNLQSLTLQIGENTGIERVGPPAAAEAVAPVGGDRRKRTSRTKKNRRNKRRQTRRR